MQTVICIGRRVDPDGLLRVEDWQQFVKDVCQLVLKHDGTIEIRAWGIGESGDCKEESFMVRFSGGDLLGIREDLPTLVRTYQQTSITLVVGDSIVVTT